MMNFGHQSALTDDVQGIVDRLMQPTSASVAWKHDYDAQKVHLEHLKKMDPRVQCQLQSVTQEQLANIVHRLHRPTTASTAKTHDFDHQDANLYYLKARDKRVSLPFHSLTPNTLRAARAAVSGRSSVHGSLGSSLSTASTTNGSSSHPYSSSGTHPTVVSSEKLDEIVERLSKPTVSSLGGLSLADKKFSYIATPRLKTLPVIPGLDTKYLCTRKVSPPEFEDIVTRLTKPTQATISRAGPDPHTRLSGYKHPAARCW